MMVSPDTFQQHVLQQLYNVPPDHPGIFCIQKQIFTSPTCVQAPVELWLSLTIHKATILFS